MIRRPIALLAALALLAGGAGCAAVKPGPPQPSTGSSAPAVATSNAAGQAVTQPRDWRPGVAVSGPALAALTSKAAADAGGQRLVNRTHVKALGMGVGVDLDLRQRPGTDPSKTAAQGRGHMDSGSNRREFELLSTGGHTYQRQPGAKWQPSTPRGAMLSADPLATVMSKAQASYVEAKGWQGARGHHLRLQVNLSEFFGSSSKTLPPVPVDLYLDDQYRPVHEEGKYAQSPVEFETLSDVTEIGTPVEIRPPSPDEVQR